MRLHAFNLHIYNWIYPPRCTLDKIKYKLKPDELNINIKEIEFPPPFPRVIMERYYGSRNRRYIAAVDFAELCQMLEIV